MTARAQDAINLGTGQILESQWAAIGPFTHGFGCNTAPENLLQNHIAPSHIGCVEAMIGDEIEYDELDAATDGYTGPLGPGGMPVWQAVNDGNEDGFINLNNALQNADDVMAWLVTYVENISDDDLEVTLCFGSDDNGQIWVDDEMVHSTMVCRGSSGCQDRPTAILTPGIHAIKMASWDRGGGWNCNLAIQDIGGLPIMPEDDLIEWLGPDLPDDYETPECPPPPQLAVRDLACVREGGDIVVTWTVPESNDPDFGIAISVNGEQIDDVDGDAEEYVVAAGDLAGIDFAQICVQPESSFLPACCGVLLGSEVYINAGGPQYEDFIGRIWQEDTTANPNAFLTSPNTNNATNNLAPNMDADEFLAEVAIDPILFNTERWSNGPVEYTVSGLNEDATYIVALFFMEHCCSNDCLSLEIGADPCDTIAFDPFERPIEVNDEPPAIDAQFASGACRVFDIYINGELAVDQFCKSTFAACLAEVPPGAPSYGIAMSVAFEEVEVVDGAITVLINDLGGGNPPENASIKALAIVESGGAPARERDCEDGVDNDDDGMTDCEDSDCEGTEPCLETGINFLRGDCNGDTRVIGQVADAVFLLNFNFTGGTVPPCMAACDADANGRVAGTVTDSIFLLNFNFLGGPGPIEPFPECAASTLESDIALGCETESCP